MVIIIIKIKIRLNLKTTAFRPWISPVNAGTSFYQQLHLLMIENEDNDDANDDDMMMTSPFYDGPTFDKKLHFGWDLCDENDD